MKCSVCGKEFGSDNHCQNCGVDRVTGLGNYRGYNVPINTVMEDEEYVPYTEQRQQLVTKQYQTVNVGSIVCYACGEVIPDNSKFCPYCSKELYVKCPKCGQTYSSQYPACNQCGTNREEFIKKLEIEESENNVSGQNRIEKLTREFENRRKILEQSPEGRAELQRERDVIEQSREKWKKTRIEEIMEEIEAKQKEKASTPEGRMQLERERKLIEESRKKWRK